MSDYEGEDTRKLYENPLIQEFLDDLKETGKQSVYWSDIRDLIEKWEKRLKQ